MTIIAYILTIVLAAFAITSIPVSLLGGIAGRVIGVHLAALLGAVVVWAGINLLWQAFEGGPVPVAALAGSFLALGVHGNAAHDDLNPMAKTLLVAEMWGILSIAVGMAIFGWPPRWF